MVTAKKNRLYLTNIFIDIANQIFLPASFKSGEITLQGHRQQTMDEQAYVAIQLNRGPGWLNELGSWTT